MSESQAEQVAVKDDLDLLIEQSLNETTEESAPQEVETPAVEIPEATKEETQAGEVTEEAPKKDRFQDRINKVTADKWEATRRAEAAEAKLAEMQTQPAPIQQSAEPTLESCDFDEAKFQSELIDFKVEQKAQSMQQQQQVTRDNQAQAQTVNNFNEASAKFASDNDIENFNDVIGKIPTLQPTVLQAVMEDSKGPELAHYLGTHLDQADSISQMNPIAAAIEIGRISAKLSEPKQIKTSSAPDPIEEIASGGHIENDIGDESSIDDWMKKHNP